MFESEINDEICSEKLPPPVDDHCVYDSNLFLWR